MDTELFVHLAEIAGVFVGFGALISLRSAHLTDVHDVVYLQAVLMLGVWRSVDAALYVTALAAGVVFAGYTLLTFVMSQKHEGGTERDDA